MIDKWVSIEYMLPHSSRMGVALKTSDKVFFAASINVWGMVDNFVEDILDGVRETH